MFWSVLRVAFHWIALTPNNYEVWYVYFSKEQLPKIELKILENMPYERFAENLRERFEVDDCAIEKLYKYRSDFAGWKEISHFVDRWYGPDAEPRYLHVPKTFQNGWEIRQVLFGAWDGPPLEALFDCVPAEMLIIDPRHVAETSFDLKPLSYSR